MSLRSLQTKKAYSSDSDAILQDFYVPALEASIKYDRLAGFFSSTSLAIAARGILGLIKNGGRMRLVVSPRLSQKDVEAIIHASNEPEEYIAKSMLSELDKLAEVFVHDHVLALGWLIANQRLDVKVAVPCNELDQPLNCDDVHLSGLFHQKVGILSDSSGNTLSFSGSINESATSWTGNIEEFKVFRDWEQSEAEYVRTDISKFERFWAGRAQRVRTLDLPHAVRDKLIEIAPDDVDKLALEKWNRRGPKFTLFEHQVDAVNNWIAQGMIGLFEMATGTGKTFAALECLDRVSSVNERLATIVTVPFIHLVEQWKNEIDKFGICYDRIVVADSSNPSWRRQLADSLNDLVLGYKRNVIILTTHRTFSSLTFTTLIRRLNSPKFRLFLIADEVHGLGAEKTAEGLIAQYDMRLGLSATPRRWFDDRGTQRIFDYFGKVVFDFSHNDAIRHGILVPYRYIPRFVSLDDEELDAYLEKTRAIVKRLSRAKDDEERDKITEMLLFIRANIIKNAKAKYAKLDEILKEIGTPIAWTIVYCSPQQIDTVMTIVNRPVVVPHRFTMEEGTTPEAKYQNLSERGFILQKFAQSAYSVLVAMKCLDQGVDIPPARTAILMASSGNPGEHIQRIGRIIRKYPSKTEAAIYDILVVPSLDRMPSDLREAETRIFERELRRYEQIATAALNSAEALSLIYDIRARLFVPAEGR